MGLAATTVDTFPETPFGTPWGFKMRIGNRNGMYGVFSSEVVLFSGVLPGPPSTLRLGWTPHGHAELSWKPPLVMGTPLLTQYEAHCSDSTGWVSTDSSLPHV